MKGFVINKIIILSSIGDSISDIEQAGVAPALYTTLCDKILEIKAQDPSTKYLTCEHTKVIGKDHFFSTLRNIEQQSKEGIRPLIHFVCHGELDGLEIWTGRNYEKIVWKDVAYSLENINIATHNNLFVTMCVCKGFYSLLHLMDDGHRIPFCGMLASPDNISVDEANILIGWFYVTLLKNFSLGEAWNKFRTSAANLYSEGELNSRWYLEQADEEFYKISAIDFKARMNLGYLWKMAKKTYKENGEHVITDKMIKSFIGENYKKYMLHCNEIIKFKFMFDLYPKERARFTLPSSIDDLREYVKNMK